MLCGNDKKYSWGNHSEILGSYLQQSYQHYVLRALFDAEPHSDAYVGTWQRVFCPISRSKLTDSVVTENISLSCSARKTHVSGVLTGIYAWSEILWKYSIVFFFAFGGITGCVSASLVLCVCDAASHWSQRPFPESQ